MARTAASPEAKILQWFRTAPPVVAGLVFGLVKDIMRERRDAPSREGLQRMFDPKARQQPVKHAAAPAHGKRPPMSAAKREHLRTLAKARWAKIRKAQAQPTHEKNWTSPHTRKRAGKGKGKKPQHGAVASGTGNGAEVESFDQQD